MGKISKTLQPKHMETLSPWLGDYVNDAANTPLPLLPKVLSEYPSRWPFGRGDLYHWIPILNRFDSILERFCDLYELNKGPQPREFGCELLLKYSGDEQLNGTSEWKEKLPADFQIAADGDKVLIEAVLKFTRMLLEHCGNRSIYASSGHLNDLLNSTCWSVLLATLEVGSELAQRYQASVRRIGNTSRQISSALLTNHYNIDLDRVLQMALPFYRTPIFSLVDSPAVTPSSKGKEKAQTSSAKSASFVNGNDLAAFASSDAITRTSWSGWGDVKLTYYPQEVVLSQPTSRVDVGKPSQPSTPTPLRRSSTVSAQHQGTTPKARNIAGDDSSPLGPQTPSINEDHIIAGQKTFDLPQSIVASTSIPELLKRCPNDMSSGTKYEVFHRLRVAKAIMNSPESRQQVLASRLLAMTNLAYIHAEPNFVEKVLRLDTDETRRFQLVYQLVELISPAADGAGEAPIWLQTISLALLEALSNFNARCQDVLSALSANVNHGVLMYVIRKAVGSMKVDNGSEDSGNATDSDHWRNNLFSLTLHLSMHTRVGPEMVSAGLMEILVEMLNIRSAIAQRHHSMVIAFLDGLIWTYQNAFNAFFNANGLDAVASLVVDTVTEARTLATAGQGTSPRHQSVSVDYTVPYYQQQTLRWLLKFVHHIMSNSYSYSGNTHRLLRNLADKSDLLQSLREVMADKQAFGSVDWTNSVTILSDFINNDPTSFAVILESGMIKTFLEAVTRQSVEVDLSEQQKSTPQDGEDNHSESTVSSTLLAEIEEDDRPHPPSDELLKQSRPTALAAGVLPTSEAINVVPQVLNSISLNNTGMKLVVSSRAFDKFLEIFESPAHVKCMENDTELAGNVGASFDELARHHPALKTSISNAVIDMVARVRFLGLEKARTSGWGAKLLVRSSDGEALSVSPDGTFVNCASFETDMSPPAASSDVDVDMADAQPGQDSLRDKPYNVLNPPVQDAFTPYLFAVSSFLSTCLSNSLLKSSFADKGGIEILLDICESPSLGPNFNESLAARVLGQLVSQMVEFSPVRGLPSMLNRAQAAIDTLEPIAAKRAPIPAYFAPFLDPDLTVPTGDKEIMGVLCNGTVLIKAFLNAQSLLKIMSECFQTSSRSNTLSFYPVNVYDHFLRLISSISPLLPGVLAEEAGQLAMVPQNWSSARSQSLDDHTRSAMAAEMDAGAPSLPDTLALSGRESAREQPTKLEQSSPQFHNYEIFRNVMHPLIPATFPLFQSLGKSLFPRRDNNSGDPYPRLRQIEIAKALANATLSHLRQSVTAADHTSKDFHYWIIMLHTISEMLVDHPPTRHSERPHPQVVMPVLLAFKEEGGLSVLSSILQAFAACVRQGNSTESEESSKPKVATFGLKKVLDIYYILSNGKTITDASSMVNLQRQTDRAQTVPNIFQQFVVELRASILPSIMELWDSPVVEKLPEATAKRLIDILKLISAAECEPSTTPTDKTPFHLLQYTDVRFNWRSARRAIEELVGEGFSEQLVQEAVFRANGHTAPARDYCRAHRRGIAGPSNPIPSEDADLSALTENQATRTERTPSQGTASSDVDRMSLDDSTSASGDNFGDLVDRASQAIDDTAETRGSATKEESSATPTTMGSQFIATKESLDKQRDDLRNDVIDRCLDVISAHPNCAIEVSELINSMVIQHQNRATHEEVGKTVTYALSTLTSNDPEDINKNGKTIAAYAHLLGLLLQNETFLQHNVDMLQLMVDDYLKFLEVSPSAITSELPPYIPYILLILETFLRYDEHPVAAQWRPPKSLDESVSLPVIQMPERLINDDQREKLVNLILNLLRRIGKEEVIATSVLRLLVILTRKRALAKHVGDKKNLQLLFLMAKQLVASGSDKIKQSKLTQHVMTILRHIVEDEDTIKQLMRAEIKKEFPNLTRNRHNGLDIKTYLQQLAHLPLRSSELFVEVTNEILQIAKWSPSNSDSTKPLLLTMKDAGSALSDPSLSKTLGSESQASQDVKESTEPADRDMSDATKSHQDSKRPLVENPDGVVHFLLSELINYREVEDKEVPVSSKDIDTVTGPSEHDSAGSPTMDNGTSDKRDKKPSKPVFKSEEHPIFIYRCFLLNCLTELLQSYGRTKVEFINFKRSAPPLSTGTPVKPRSSVLNYLIYDLLCQGNLSGTNDSITSKKKAATSTHTQRLLVALVSLTKERTYGYEGRPNYTNDEEPDLQFVRKFVLDTILKAYERAPVSDEPLETRYSRMQSLAELMNHMIGENNKEHMLHSRTSDWLQDKSQFQLRRLMYEKGYLEKLTSSIAEVNLNYPNVKRAIKYILRVLRVLTDTAKELSQADMLPTSTASDTVEDDVYSTSSLSDLEDDREETPDLYRNSSLGMLEPRDDDESEEDDEDADDMYADEYGDEMEYEEEGISDDDQDNISEDSEMGEIEGLSGEPGVVEVIMDDDDDDDDDDDEDDDDDDDSDDDDDGDDLDSADMEDVESRVEILNEDGLPMEDDGASGWESEDDAEDEELEAELDYEAGVQDADEAHIHGLVPPHPDLLMARALMEGDNFDATGLMDERYLDDAHDDDEEEDEGEEMDDEEYIYDDDYPIDEEPIPVEPHGWDDIDSRLLLLDHQASHNRRRALTRLDNRGPFQPGSGFVVGSHGGGEIFGDFRSYFSRTHRAAGPNSNNDDGVNPLLRRPDQRQDAPVRPSPHNHVGVRLPEGFLGGINGRQGADNPVGFLGDLMDILPVVSRGGQSLHFHITGHGGRDGRDVLQARGPRHEQRRETSVQDPYQAVAFGVRSTMERYQEEVRMIFGHAFGGWANRLINLITAKLMPAAMEAEKQRLAEETERKKRAEEERVKREEEERRVREEKEAEERAAREQKEAEERQEREEREAAERDVAAAGLETEAQPDSNAEAITNSAMEGIEQSNTTEGSSTINNNAGLSQPRVMAMLGDQEIDVTDLGIDPDYLAALPEEFREEVIAQTVSARRSEARAEAPAGETAAFQEFLDALPPQLRREIEQQEAQEQRRRDNGNNRPAASTNSRDIIAGDMDPASILLTFPPELREQVLMEQGDEIMDQLPPDMADQARRLRGRNNPEPYSAAPAHRPSASSRRPFRASLPRPQPNKPPRRAVVQMLDKAGVATLVRLMFITQQGSIRNYLFCVFADVCQNRQNRLEVISTVLQILQEGSTDMMAVERSFSQLSLKARKHREKEREADQKTPQGLKRTLTNITQAISSEPNTETSPLLIVQQCLDLLVDLCNRNPHIPWLFLTEHEAVASTLKRTLSRKGKAKDTKASKYAINSILALLDRDLVMESSVVMTHLAELLNRTTLPLQALERRRKEEEATAASAAKAEGEAASSSNVVGEPSTQSNDAKPAADMEEQGTTSETVDKKDDQAPAPERKARPLQPPVIPPQNLTLVVKVFVARECSSKTFQNTISTIKNLSTVPGASSIFGQELVRQARLLSENIVSDLDELLPHIEKATTGTEIQGVALAKFSPGASEQNKLLRVLTALDHLFDSKKQSDGDAQNEKQDLVVSLYHNSTFSAMWDKLSACLSAIHERENMFNVATILLPLIESLMVVCKNTTTQDDPSQNLIQTSKEMMLSSPPPESRTASLFFSFTEAHRRILNELVRNNPKLMSGTFALLVKNPKVLEFDNKRNYFNRSVHSRTGQPSQGRPSFPALNLAVRRDQVFHDSFRYLYFKSGDEMKFGKLNIRFHGEEGVDAGGVTREWFQVLSRQMFDPNYVLYIPVSSDRTTFHPNKLSGINDEHLSFFKFIGRIIGKALYEGRLLDCYFSRAVYKRILGKSVSVKDMESFDPDYYKSLCWMLENDITDIITETFSVEDEEFGMTNVVDLIPSGRDVPVTEENKHDYVRLVVEHKLLSSVKEQMEHFLKGFHDIIPAELISIFNEQELELLISGLPEIDVDDWKGNTEYQNYNATSAQIQWFWRAVRSFDKEERAKLLQFVTGTSKVPLNGFKELEGMNGVNRFNIHRDYGNKDRLPSSHTCFNQLDLPEYDNYDALRSQLIKAITAGSEYFGFA